MNYTEILCDWAASLQASSIPAECDRKAKEQLKNILAASILGVGAESSQGVLRAFNAFDRGGPSSVLGTGRRMAPANAAFVNAFFAQIFEYEDWVVYSHSGASVISTALAMGESEGCDGRELLTAIVMGNEIAGRTGLAIARGAYVGNSLPNHQVDSAFIAARMLKLTPRQYEDAIGLSSFVAMEPCPLGFMTDSKGLINSFPVHAGIVSAYMAREGLVGGRGALEHPAGFLSTVSEFLDLDELTRDLGSKWVLPTLHSKPYPICGYNISPIHAALELHREHAIDHRQIDHVIVYAAGVTLYAGNRFQAFETSIFDKIEKREASHVPLLFDVPYPMAAALVDGELTPRQYDRAHIFDPVIRDLAGRIELRVDPDMHEAYYRFQYASRVEIYMKDGTVLSKYVPQMPGASDNEFDVDAKFLSGTSPVLGDRRAEQALALIDSLEEVDSVGRLTELLVPAPAGAA